jgi:hypothetical protein
MIRVIFLANRAIFRDNRDVVGKGEALGTVDMPVVPRIGERCNAVSQCLKHENSVSIQMAAIHHNWRVRDVNYSSVNQWDAEFPFVEYVYVYVELEPETI